MERTATPRQRRPWAIVVVLAVAVVAGGVIGGYLHFGAWHANGAVASAIPVTASFLIGVGAGIWWLRSRSTTAALLAVAGAGFFAGTQIGAWVAPTAQRPDWSPGTVRLELTSPVVGKVSGDAACFTNDDGSFTVQSDTPQTLSGSPVQYYVRGAGPDRNRGSISFWLTAGSAPEGPVWTTEFETSRAVDILDVVRITGTAAEGTADLVGIPHSPESPTGDAFGAAASDSIGGIMAWTCEPPIGEPTPIEGTWFQ